MTFTDYNTAMTTMFNRHGDISEEVRLSILTKNLAPFYLMQVPSVTTLLELENECLKLEALSLEQIIIVLH